MTSSGICFSAEHKQRCWGCYSSLRYPPFFFYINYNILIVLRFPSRQNSAKSPIMSKSTAGLLLSASQQTQALLLTYGGCFPWMPEIFFFSLYAGSHWSFQICLSKENVTFIKKKQQQWRASVVYQPSLSNYYRCINHIDARCYHYFSPLLT